MPDVTQVDSLAPPLGRWVAFLRRLIRDTRAQDSIEYGMLVGVFATLAVLSIPSVSEVLHKVLLNVQEVMESAACGNPNPGNFGGSSPCAPFAPPTSPGPPVPPSPPHPLHPPQPL